MALDTEKDLNKKCHWEKLAWTFLQNAHLITKYLLPEKISLLTSLQAEIKGEGGGSKTEPICLAKCSAF